MGTVLCLIGMTAAGQLLLAGIVMYFGMSIGGMLSVMILRYGWKGILLSLSFWSAAGSVLYSGGQYGNQPAGSPGRAEERQNAGISYGRKKEK